MVVTVEGDPERAAQAGTLHPDLAALFGARVVTVPPLAERTEDVPALAARFVEAAAAELGRRTPELTARAVDRLRALPWRGNVRELKAAVEGAVALAPGGIIDADLLPTDDAPPGAATGGSPPPAIDLSVGFAELKDRWSTTSSGVPRRRAAPLGRQSLRGGASGADGQEEFPRQGGSSGLTASAGATRNGPLKARPGGVACLRRLSEPGEGGNT